VAGLIIALAVIQRAAVIWVYRSWFRQGFAGDAAFHLAVIQRLKEEGGYDGVPQFLIRDEADTYPVLFHRFAAALPLSLIRRYQYLPNLILWGVLASVLAFYILYFGTVWSSGSADRLLALFFLFFLTSVSNLSLDMNGLNYISLSERMLSRFGAGFFFLALSVYLQRGDTISLVSAAVAGAVTFLSSMFGRQAIVFVVPIVCLGMLDLRPLFVAGLSFALSVLFDGRYLLRGIRQMAQFSHGYFHHVRHSRYVKLGHSRFVNLRAVLGRGTGVRARIAEVEQGEPTRLLFRYPELVLLAGLIGAGQINVSGAEVAICLATLAVYFATTTKALRHFGEANRYLEFNLWMLPSFMLARNVPAVDRSFLPYALYFVWVLLMTVRAYHRWFSLKFPDHDRLAAFVKPLGLQSSNVIFSVPFTLGAAVNARVKCRSLMYQGSAVTLALYEKFMEEAPFLKRDWKKLASEFGVTHVLAEKSYLAVMKDIVGWEYDFSSLPVLAESEAYIAYKC
jgi:hypothetical protein